MTEHPFTGDGIQAVTVHAEGHTWQPWPTIYKTAREAQSDTERSVEYWATLYTDRITVDYYGYDPIVREDDGTPIGTDGMPDWHGTYNPVTEEVDWERG